MTRASRPFAWLTVAYLVIIGWITFGPTPWRTRPAAEDYDVLSPSTWLDEGTWTRLSSGEFVANILLFVPLGLLLRLAFPRVTWVGAALLGGGITVAIEVLQVWTPRVSDPRDVLANSAGAILGAIGASVVAAVVGRRRAARQLPERAVR